jgi:hypothetical protein
MTTQQLDEIFDALEDVTCPSEMGIVLLPLSYDDLLAVEDDLFDQYSQELALGALERSEWLCGNLIINANQPSICLTRTALGAIRGEIEARKAMAARIATGILN